MKLPWSVRWLLLPGLALGVIITVTVLADQIFEVHYTFIGIGTILVGWGAIWTAYQKADEAQHTANKVEKQINGGMSESAKQHVEEAIANSELEVGLWRRVDALEQSKQECVEREKRCEEENEKLRDWVVARLDQTPLGRNENR